MLSQTPRFKLATKLYRSRIHPAFRQLRLQVFGWLDTSGSFLISCYTEGLRAIFTGNFTRRQAFLIIAASLPAILALLLTTVPSILFPTPGHQAFYYFATNLQGTSTTLILASLGLASATLGLKIPLG